MLNYSNKPRPTDQLYSKFKDVSASHRELIIKFFISFARLEFLLKWKDYIKDDGEVLWQKFYCNKNIQFENSLRIRDDSKLQSAIKYLNQHPPKKLIKKDGELNWREFEDYNNCLLEQLCLYVKRVRNNLFHGNKSISLGNSRDEQLLRHSLYLIDELVTLLDGETDFVEESI